MDVVMTGRGLLEGPVFDPLLNRLLFADALDGGMWSVGPDGDVEVLFEHRRGIGGSAIHADGGVVVSGRTLAHKVGNDTTILCELPAGANRFNDLTTDREGRVYVGSVFYEFDVPIEHLPSGFLHLVDLDGSCSIVLEGVEVSNGLAFSCDGSLLYHCRSGMRSLHAYDIETPGQIGADRVVVAWADGLPDGLAIDDDGNLFVAMHGLGHVSVLSPDGSEIDRIAVPQRNVTNVCFAGDDLRTLYVTTATDETGASATLYRTRVATPGMALHPAQVRPIAE